MPLASPAMSAEHLTKRYGEIAAVDDVSFEVARGEIFALLGPNGAGKSTTINVLCTLAAPTAGTAHVAGFDVTRNPTEVRRSIGLVFQEQTLDEQLTAEENLRFHAVLYGMDRASVEARITHVLELVALGNRRTELVSTYSGGMARRLEIARGMLHTPTVLFLDEPTLGLDPQTRVLMWEDVRRMRDEEGTTVLLTTHYMDEAEYADRIAIIDGGRIVAIGSPAQLKAQAGEEFIEVETRDDEAARRSLAAAGYHVHPHGRALRMAVTHGEEQVGRVVTHAGVPVTSLRVHRPTLDDVFLHFTGREIREQGGEGSHMAMARAWRRRR